MDRIPGNHVDDTRPPNIDESSDREEDFSSVAVPPSADESAPTPEEAPEAMEEPQPEQIESTEETAETLSFTSAEEAPEAPSAVEESPDTRDEERLEVPASEGEAVTDGSIAAEEGVSLLDDWQPGEWLVVHTYAGYENKVKANLLTRIQSMNMEDRIYEVVIPMEDVVEMKGGKKQVVQRKVFPGYLLVRMDLDDDSWYVVRNTPGVTGFVGSASKPIPLSESEVDNILKRGEAAEEERPRPRAEWQINDPVRVTTGPFANFQGVVSEIDLDRSKLKVLVNIFGRETPVELGFDQVSKV